jgi:hypothetical protein
MATCDTDLIGACIARKRGDTAPDRITILDQDSAAVPKDPLDITGFSFTLTINTEQDPDPGPPIGAELVSIAGTITDPLAGEVEFPWTPLNADQVPEEYFYDIQQIDASSRLLTIAKNQYIFQQDITK